MHILAVDGSKFEIEIDREELKKKTHATCLPADVGGGIVGGGCNRTAFRDGIGITMPAVVDDESHCSSSERAGNGTDGGADVDELLSSFLFCG